MLTRLPLLEQVRSRPKLVIAFFILYYGVGLGLFMIPDTRQLFSLLTPLTLVLTFTMIMVFHKTWKWKTLFAFVIVFLFAILIEIAGVQTGILFGSYEYGDALGIKVSDTPVIIGLNWLFLIYCTSAIVNSISIPRIARILVGSGLMVAYDLVLEYVAPLTDMWSWETSYPGIRNFGMWFLVSLAFHSLFQWLDLRITNKPATYLFLIQFLFFAIIALYTLI